MSEVFEVFTKKPLNDSQKSALNLLLVNLEKAREKHPYFPGDQRAIAIIAEEYLELIREVNDYPEIYKSMDEKRAAKERQLAEALNLGVTVFRFIERLQGEIK